jgi:hypothetical protein
MPFEGSWAPVSSNFPGSEVKACAAVAKFGLARLSGNADDVEIIAFTSTKRLDFGGYADDESSHISMTGDSGGGYIFRDRWYDDGEGGGRARLKTKTYAVRMIDPLNLEITEGKVRTRYVKCVPSTAVHASTAARPRSHQGPGPVRPPQVAETATPDGVVVVDGDLVVRRAKLHPDRHVGQHHVDRRVARDLTQIAIGIVHIDAPLQP